MRQPQFAVENSLTAKNAGDTAADRPVEAVNKIAKRRNPASALPHRLGVTLDALDDIFGWRHHFWLEAINPLNGIVALRHGQNGAVARAVTIGYVDCLGRITLMVKSDQKQSSAADWNRGAINFHPVAGHCAGDDRKPPQ